MGSSMMGQQGRAWVVVDWVEGKFFLGGCMYLEGSRDFMQLMDYCLASK